MVVSAAMVDYQTQGSAAMAYCLIHSDRDGRETVCELVGNVCFDTYRTMRAAYRRAASLSRLALANGWQSSYRAAPLPAGATAWRG
jgi:hypothetical protein